MSRFLEAERAGNHPARLGQAEKWHRNLSSMPYSRKETNGQIGLDQDEPFFSTEKLARRWYMSRAGAIRTADRTGVRSMYAIGWIGSTRRFRLSAIVEYERSVTA